MQPGLLAATARILRLYTIYIYTYYIIGHNHGSMEVVLVMMTLGLGRVSRL